MFVRRATMQEADGLYALACGAARRELPRNVFDALLTDALRRSSRRILTASENGEVMGYVDAELRPSLTQCAMVGVVCDLFVKEGCRGRGVGTALMINLATQLKRLGCVCLTADCSRVNVRSQEFLEKRGFARAQYHFVRELH